MDTTRTPRQRTHSTRAVVLFAVLALLATLAPSAVAPAQAAATPVTDRETSQPTGWFWYVGVTPDVVSDRLDEHGARLTDVEVVSTSPLLLDVEMVTGGGDYHVDAWWWYHGLTFDQIGPLLERNAARLIDIDRYATDAGHRYAVVMVDNTGDDGRGWWWFSGVTTSFIEDFVARNDARILDLDRGPDGTYDVVLIRNTGSDATSWWWFHNITSADLADFTREHGARIIDIEDRAGGRHDAVLVRNGGRVDTWWWYHDVPLSTLSEFVAQHGARVIDLERAGDRTFHAALVDNMTDHDRDIWSAANAGLEGGRFGWHLEQVGGGTKSAFRNTTVTDPASALKGLHHLHAHRQVMLGNDSLVNPFTFYNYTTTQPNPKDACPDPSEETPDNAQSTSLGDALWRMMRNSDNRTTRGVVLRYGVAALEATGVAAGMTDTAYHQDIGCGFRDGLRNETTMRDLARLYTSVANGAMLSGTARDEFWDDMLGGPGTLGGLNDVVAEEAAALGLTAAQLQEFYDNARIRAKGGSYNICGSTCASYEYIRANAGLVELPHKRNPRSLVSNGKGRSPKVKEPYRLRQFTYGVFTDRLTLTCMSCAQDGAANAAFDALRDELFRDEIRKALKTFD